MKESPKTTWTTCNSAEDFVAMRRAADKSLSMGNVWMATTTRTRFPRFGDFLRSISDECLINLIR